MRRTLLAVVLVAGAGCAPRSGVNTPWIVDAHTATLSGSGVSLSFGDDWYTQKSTDLNYTSLDAEWTGPRWGSQYSPRIKVFVEAVPEGTTLRQYLVDGAPAVRITPDRRRPSGELHHWSGFPLLSEMERGGWQLHDPVEIDWNGQAALEVEGYLPFDKLHLRQRTITTPQGVVTVAATWREKQLEGIAPEIDAVFGSLALATP